jgi:hypothetical protein
MVAVSPPTVNISSSVVEAKAVPKPIASSETRSVVFVKIFIIILVSFDGLPSLLLPRGTWAIASGLPNPASHYQVYFQQDMNSGGRGEILDFGTLR